MDSFTRDNGKKSSKMGKYTQAPPQQGVPQGEAFGDSTYGAESRPTSEGSTTNSFSLPSRPASRVQEAGTQRPSSLPPPPASLPPRPVVPAGRGRLTKQDQLRKAIQQSMSGTSPSMSHSDWDIQSGPGQLGYGNPRPNYENVPNYQGHSGAGNPPRQQNVPYEQGHSRPGSYPHRHNVPTQLGNSGPGSYPHQHNVPTQLGHSGPGYYPNQHNVPTQLGHSGPGYYPNQHNVPSHQGHSGPGSYPPQHNVPTHPGHSGFTQEARDWRHQQGPLSYQHLGDNANLYGSNADPNGPTPYQGNLAQGGPAPYQGTRPHGGTIHNTGSMQGYANTHGYTTQPRVQQPPSLSRPEFRIPPAANTNANTSASEPPRPSTNEPISYGPPYFGLPPGDRVEVGARRRQQRPHADNGPPYFGLPPGDRFEIGAGRGRGQRPWMGSSGSSWKWNPARPPQVGYQPRMGSKPRPGFDDPFGPDNEDEDEDEEGEGEDEAEHDEEEDKEVEERDEEEEEAEEEEEEEPSPSPSPSPTPQPRSIRMINRRHLVALHEIRAARPRDTGSVKKYRVHGASPFRHLAHRGAAFKWACKELKVRDWEWDGIMERRRREFPGGCHMEWREDGTPEGGNWYVVADEEGEGEGAGKGKGKGKWEERRDRVNRKGGPRGGPGKRGESEWVSEGWEAGRWERGTEGWRGSERKIKGGRGGCIS